MSVIDMLGDLSIDIPKSPIYLANFIGFAISDNYLPITFLEHAFDNIQESSSNKNMHPMRLGAEVFRTIAKTSVRLYYRHYLMEQRVTRTCENCIILQKWTLPNFFLQRAMVVSGPSLSKKRS